MKIHLDFETRSAVDLKKAGLHIYAEDPTTSVLCACWAIDNGPVQIWLPSEPLPLELADAIDAGYEIHAWNAAFERTIWREVMVPQHGWAKVPDHQFVCTMCEAYAMGLPGSLDQCAQALHAKLGKDIEGYKLMLKMCKPRAARKGEAPGLYWNYSHVMLERLAKYCARDVEVERMVGRSLLPLSPEEREVYLLDQQINDNGVYVDLDLVKNGIELASFEKKRLNAHMNRITGGLATCSKPAKIIEFMQALGVDIDSVAKAKLADHLDDPDVEIPLPPLGREVLLLRREFAKTSVEKLPTLLAGTGADNRIRGLLQYHGASTGRWTGRRFQPQNLLRPTMKHKWVEEAVKMILAGEQASLEWMFGPIMTVIADCVRSCLVASPGYRLMSADYANIEGRVLAWLAGEEWKLQAFIDYDAGTGHDLYKLSYGRAFDVRPEDVVDTQRQLGKVMELALGFGGGVGAFQSMAKNYGVKVPDAQADELKFGWRDVHPMTVAFWANMEQAAFNAVVNPGRIFTARLIKFMVNRNWLIMRLPSGRYLYYRDPHIKAKETPWKEMKDQVHYWGMNSYTRKWELCSAYGGLWVENAVQATARDIMANAMIRADAAGYNIVLTVHDEIVADQHPDIGSLDHMVAIMQENPAWAAGLPTAVAGWEGARYRKG